LNSSGDIKEKRIILLFIFLAILVYLISWTIPIIEIDAAQYANISREMLHSRSFLELYDRGQDYLDKPPMLFWLSSLSMYIFGIHGAAYRLPSFMFSLLAIYSTYRLANLYYREKIALFSALVLASSQAMFLINHDVRTDTMLMGWVAFALWQMAAWYKFNKWKNLLLASVGIAGGLLTKGPIALMVPVFAFAPHFFLQRAFRQFFRWQYLIMLLIIGILLIPMCIGLYKQFDLHPEKIVYGKSGNSGLRFFFWTQSFGRITGESTWSENGYFFFLFQNLLWGFLPWTIFFIGGLIDDILQIVRKRFYLSRNEEWISTGGFLVAYCALGMSRYQLPHYIYVVLPLAAIITGKWIYKFFYTDDLIRWRNPLFVFHAIVFSLLIVALFCLLYFPFPPPERWIIVLFILFLIAALVLLIRKKIALPALISMSVMAILITNLFIDIGFYPPLMQYQSGIGLSQMIKKNNWDKDRFYIYKINEDRSLHFYSDHFFLHVNNPDSLKKGDYLLTSGKWLDSVGRDKYNILDTVQDFHVSTLSVPFLNPSRRGTEITPLYILQHQ
jgi:4-amino-4-deoxy-L-arabinose transferase-like glycosyltransferase